MDIDKDFRFPDAIEAQIKKMTRSYEENLRLEAYAQLNNLKLEPSSLLKCRAGALPGVPKPHKRCPVIGCKSGLNTRLRYGYHCKEHTGIFEAKRKSGK